MIRCGHVRMSFEIKERKWFYCKVVCLKLLHGKILINYKNTKGKINCKYDVSNVTNNNEESFKRLQNPAKNMLLCVTLGRPRNG